MNALEQRIANLEGMVHNLQRQLATAQGGATGANMLHNGSLVLPDAGSVTPPDIKNLELRAYIDGASVWLVVGNGTTATSVELT